MAQVYEYNSKKNVFKVMYNFIMHDSLPPCSELNKNLKQIDYLMLAVQFTRGKSGLSTHTIFAMLHLRKARHMLPQNEKSFIY